jgi:hypothetical protein
MGRVLEVRYKPERGRVDGLLKKQNSFVLRAEGGKGLSTQDWIPSEPLFGIRHFDRLDRISSQARPVFDERWGELVALVTLEARSGDVLVPVTDGKASALLVMRLETADRPLEHDQKLQIVGTGFLDPGEALNTCEERFDMILGVDDLWNFVGSPMLSLARSNESRNAISSLLVHHWTFCGSPYSSYARASMRRRRPTPPPRIPVQRAEVGSARSYLFQTRFGSVDETDLGSKGSLISVRSI